MWRTLGTNALLAALYFTAAKLGLSLAVLHPSASAVWPPTGIALAALLLFGYRAWPAIAIGAFLANITTAGTWATSLGISAGNTLEGVLGAWLVNRFAGGRHTLSRPQDMLRFIALAAGVSTTVSATMGVTSLALAGYADWSDWGAIWTTWWLGDTTGALIFAPPILLWATEARPRRIARPLEAAAAGALLIVTGIAFFGGIGEKNAPIEWLWIPAVVWVAFRFGQRAAATTVMGISVVAVWGTLLGQGPFTLSSPNTSLLLLQAFTGVVAVMALVLSAVVSARDRATADLERSRTQLETRVADRTRMLAEAVESLQSEVAERARLEGELVEVGERERMRLGRDLHDDLGQLLTGIAYLSSAMERRLSAHSGSEASSAKEIQGLVQQAIVKTHRLALGLAPVDLGGDGLVAAIHELAAMTERAFGVTCMLECRTAPMLEDPLAATSLYRITQEAISNAVRHGKARRIRITLNVEGGAITLTVLDDGVGLSGNADTPAGLGLRFMRQRAEQLGGTFEIRADGLGTTVICRVPEGAVSDTGSDRVGIDPNNPDRGLRRDLDAPGS